VCTAATIARPAASLRRPELEHVFTMWLVEEWRTRQAWQQRPPCTGRGWRRGGGVLLAHGGVPLREDGRVVDGGSGRTCMAERMSRVHHSQRKGRNDAGGLAH
jgi:hypothetical protein